VFLIARVSTLASFDPTTGAIELVANLLIITWVDVVPSILTSFTVKNDDQPSMYALRDTSVIVEKVASNRLILLLIRKPITKQSGLLGLVKLDLPMNLHLQHLK